MAEFQLSQRDLEGILEDLDPIYRRIEDCDEIDELRGYARTLLDVARRLEYLASDYENAADEAESALNDEGKYCAVCGDEYCDECGECRGCGYCHCVETDEEPDVQDPYDTEYDRN